MNTKDRLDLPRIYTIIHSATDNLLPGCGYTIYSNGTAKSELDAIKGINSYNMTERMPLAIHMNDIKSGVVKNTARSE